MTHQTDNMGNANFVIPNGTGSDEAEFSVDHNGFKKYTQHFFISKIQSGHTFYVVLEQIEQLIIFEIYDSQTNKPLLNAAVTIIANGNPIVKTTDKTGIVKFQNLNLDIANEVRIVVNAKGYKDFDDSRIISTGSPEKIILDKLPKSPSTQSIPTPETKPKPVISALREQVMLPPQPKKVATPPQKTSLPVESPKKPEVHKEPIQPELSNSPPPPSHVPVESPLKKQIVFSLIIVGSTNNFNC